MGGSWHGLILVAAVLALPACGGKEGDAAPASAGQAAGSGQPGGDLTAFELEHGIGPVTEPIQLGPVNEDMAEEGKTLFETKCLLCHKMEERYVGPPLGDVTTRRTPAFIMNMILNPEAMYTRHPVVRQLLADHMTQMPNLALTQEQARQVVEYLRTTATSGTGD